MHFSDGFYNLPESAKNAASPQSTLKRMLRIAGYTLLRLYGNLLQSVERPGKLQGKVWLYVVSQNNYDSLQFVQKGMPEAVFVAGQSKDIGKYNAAVERISLRRKLLYYYKFPILLQQFLTHKKKNTLRFFDLLYDAIGFYEIYYRKLQKYSPAAVVFANDHNADARAMLLAAKALDIKTIYIQHSSVSLIFPPLTFDLNLLEGQDSLDKYRKCGTVQGKVELIGMPKADAFVTRRNFSRCISRVGIGCNLLDDLKEVENLLHKLTVAFPDMKIILRPHPRDTRNLASLLTITNNVLLSDSRTEPVFNYLQQLDVQVSSNSGIHLEAVLLNVWSLFYDFNPEEQLHDYYGFINHGLVDVIKTPDHMIQTLYSHLNNKPRVFERAQYYNATVATEYDGKSSEIALHLIRSFLEC